METLAKKIVRPAGFTFTRVYQLHKYYLLKLLQTEIPAAGLKPARRIFPLSCHVNSGLAFVSNPRAGAGRLATEQLSPLNCRPCARLNFVRQPRRTGRRQALKALYEVTRS
jgi:hypothetical protein